MESEDLLIPVPQGEVAIADADSLLIHSKLRTASCKEFTGLVICQSGTYEVFAIEIFAKDQRFTFNKNVYDMSMDELKRFATLINGKIDHMMPIHFEVVPDGLPLKQGSFSF